MKGFACLEKEEKLALYDFSGNELVLNDETPFPGYYSHVPDEISEKPRMLFLVLKPSADFIEDKIMRINCKLKTKVDYIFETAFGHLFLYNKEVPCIRLIISDLAKIPDLIKHFKKGGIRFEKAKSLRPFDSFIRIRKYVNTKKLAPGVYKGKQANFYYLEVPKKLDWADFVNMILSIKGSRQFKSFDAAQFSLYRKNKIREFVRIYTKYFTNDDFLDLRAEILKQIERFD